MICPPGGDGLSSSGGRVFSFLGDQDSERVPRVCFQKHKSKKKLKKYAVSLLKPKGKQVVDVEYNL